ncbi:MAG: hypothetical protein NZ480_04350 [Bdellovibrionaceae bacterium]|nr:hypothetical protein [Pseudobdellovibrionaceae bacterium]MDW8190690.1 hypothetical protein [Pseudobdellovibrionaceae bacterium]
MSKLHQFFLLVCSVSLFGIILVYSSLVLSFEEDSEKVPGNSEFFFRAQEKQWVTELKGLIGTREYTDSNVSPHDLTRFGLQLIYGFDETINLGVRGSFLEKVESKNNTIAEGFGDPEVFLLTQNENVFVAIGLTLHVAKATIKTTRLGGNQFYFSYGVDYGNDSWSYGFNTQIDLYTDRRIYQPDEVTYARLEGSSGLKLSFFGEKKWENRGLLGASVLLEYLSEVKYRYSPLGQLARIHSYPAPFFEAYARLNANDHFHLIVGGGITLGKHLQRMKFELPVVSESTSEYSLSYYYLEVRVIF